jgi:peptidoglycan hydrolase CwlO-like protein
MHRTVWRMFAAVAALGVLILVRTGVSAQTAAPAQNPEVLSALLVEVRGLRAAMEQMASAGPRVQLALGRLQLQEQRVNNLMRQLDTVRGNLAQTQRQEEEMRRQIAGFEEPGGKWTPDERAAVEQQLRNMKAQQPLVAADIQRLQAEEATISQQIAAEQGRWSDINQRLEELERALARK